jgi:hypothetical protein
MTFQDYSDLDGDFSQAEVSTGFDTVPDGNYQTIVDGVAFKTARKTGDRFFLWTFKILTGDFEGHKIRKVEFLKPDRLKWFKTDLSRCGWQAKTITEVANDLGRLLDLEVEIRLQTKDKYQNVFIQRLISGDVEPDRSDGPPPPEDDIPF